MTANTQAPETEVVDLRCPVDARELLMRYHREVGRPPVSNNLMELSCRVCTRRARDQDDGVLRILHRFDLVGELVESVVVRR